MVAVITIMHAIGFGLEVVRVLLGMVAWVDATTEWGYDVSLDVVIVLVITALLLSELLLWQSVRLLIHLVRTAWTAVEGHSLAPLSEPTPAPPPLKWLFSVFGALALSSAATRLESLF